MDELNGRAMAGRYQVLLRAHPSIVDALARLVRRRLAELESLWSRFLEGSDIDRLNRAAGATVDVSTETVVLLGAMLESAHRTNGEFDPTVLPALVRLGYAASLDDPDRRSFVERDARSGVGIDGIALDPVAREVSMPHGVALDPGGLGKGLAADMLVDELLRAGADGALVNLAGDLAAAGEPPDEAGWTISIEDPFDDTRCRGRIAVSGGGVATSSTLTRRWRTGSSARRGRHEGAAHHLLDPATGTPISSDLISVTVVAGRAWSAEAATPSLLMAGSEGLTRRATELGVEAIAFTVDGNAVGRPEMLDLLDAPTRSSTDRTPIHATPTGDR